LTSTSKQTTLALGDSSRLREENSGIARELLTADEVAAMLGMGVDWVWAQARKGRIPHVKLGRFRRFRRQAILVWLEEMERGDARR
jgi:excisionase family DNA binding protein